MSSYHIASLLHRALTMTTFPLRIRFLLETYAFSSDINFHMMELTVLLLDGTHLDPLSPGCKHPGQPLRSGHGIRSESWTRWELQLVREFQGKGVESRPTVGVQWHEVLVGSIYGSLSTWIPASTSSSNAPIPLNVDYTMLIAGVVMTVSLML